jgi:hypothetical protein
MGVNMKTKNPNELVIAVDFDGTVVFHDYPNVGDPVPHALYYLKKIQDTGIKIILYTMRSEEYLDDAVKYLTGNGIKLFGVNENPTQSEWTTSTKIYSHLYIDDAAFGCPLIHNPKNSHRPYVDWSIVGPTILRDIGIPAG